MSAPLGIFVDNTNPSGSDSWALVLNGVVGNVQIGTYADMQAIQASWDYLVDITQGGQTAGIGFTYDSGNDTFAPPVPTLEQAINTAITNFQNDWQTYRDGYYDQDTIVQFMIAQFTAKQNNDAAQLAYIAPLLTWLYSMTIYKGQVVSAIQAMTDVQTVLNYTWNVGGSTGAVPNITLLGVSLAG